jgi:hypothetical protein
MFSERPTVNGTGVLLSGDIDTSNFYTNDNLSGFITGISDLVYTTGDQVISGLKTFSQGISIEGDSSLSALFVSGQRIGVNNENPQASLDISGSTMFSERPTVNGTGVLLSGDIDTSNFYTNDNLSGFITGISDLVYTTGDQTISGRKLFSDGLDAGLQVGVSTLYIGAGLVGVNNEDPQAAFHVSGSALFANDVTILGNFAVSGTTYVNEVIDVTSTGIISGVTGVFQHLEADNIVYNETASYIVVQPGDDLIVKYTAAKLLTPDGLELSATNRASLIILPGSYSIASELVIDTQFVDIIGLGAQIKKPAVFVNDNTLNVTANDVRVSAISVGSQAFKTYSTNPLQVFENCVGGDNSFAANTAYGIVDGKFINCIGGDYSFGSSYADGIFENCIGGNYSFGFQEANGAFKNCTGGHSSFARGGEANGEFINCTGGDYSFGGAGGDTNGIFVNCVGGNTSFAGNGIARGTFTDCTAGSYSFGAGRRADGIFSNCIGGESSFGGDIGQMRGKLFNCRLTYGTYNNPSGAGSIIRSCIDGNGDLINASA